LHLLKYFFNSIERRYRKGLYKLSFIEISIFLKICFVLNINYLIGLFFIKALMQSFLIIQHISLPYYCILRI